MTPIYLDYAATTPAAPNVVEKMHEVLLSSELFGNPASRHYFGHLAETLVEKARAQAASLLNCDEKQIYWTSGTTESNNLVIKGLASRTAKQKCHLVISAIEHAAVLQPCAFLERQGFEVTVVKPENNGVVSLEKLLAAVNDKTFLISLMHVNNETGMIQPVEALANALAGKAVMLHVDAAQSVGKIAIDLAKLPIDFLSFSAHKIYGPKGIGGLYIRNSDKQPEPLFHGGGHEGRLRSGTLATHQIVGAGEALSIAEHMLVNDYTEQRLLNQTLVNGLGAIDGLVFNTDFAKAVPNIINFSVPDIDGEQLMAELNQLAVSFGSACSADSQEPSHVLKAMGLTKQHILSSIRLSIGRPTTETEIDRAVEQITAAVAKLRKRKSLWR